MVTEIITAITSAVTGLLGGLGTGIVGFFQSIFMDGESVSALGIFIFVGLGISLALGAVALIFNLVKNRGN